MLFLVWVSACFHHSWLRLETENLGAISRRIREATAPFMYFSTTSYDTSKDPRVGAKTNHLSDRVLKAALNIAKDVRFFIKVTYELPRLDSNSGLCVKFADDRRYVEVMRIRELARTESMVAVPAGSMVAMTKRDG